MIIWDNGKIRPMTAEEVSAWERAQAEMEVQPITLDDAEEALAILRGEAE